jgi:hypothetical protein
MTAPFLTLARQMVRPPIADDPSDDRSRRQAGCILRLAHEAMTSDLPFDEASETFEPWENHVKMEDQGWAQIGAPPENHSNVPKQIAEGTRDCAL